uniref:Integron gene cassette protein n=1 Tax=Macrostomum lignano TaxID=282301 RepID=A0A1I8IZ09_9PLAT
RTNCELFAEKLGSVSRTAQRDRSVLHPDCRHGVRRYPVHHGICLPMRATGQKEKAQVQGGDERNADPVHRGRIVLDCSTENADLIDSSSVSRRFLNSQCSDGL